MWPGNWSTVDTFVDNNRQRNSHSTRPATPGRDRPNSKVPTGNPTGSTTTGNTTIGECSGVHDSTRIVDLVQFATGMAGDRGSGAVR